MAAVLKLGEINHLADIPELVLDIETYQRIGKGN
jgi:hypothetical protein